MSTVGYLVIFVLVMGAALALSYAVEHKFRPGPAEQAHIQSVFAFIGSGYGVLLGILVFLALQNYNDAEESAATEASAVISEYRIVQVLPPDARRNVQRSMYCYAQIIINEEWPTLEEGGRAPTEPGDLWSRRAWRELGGMPTNTPTLAETYQVAIDTWAERAEARDARLVFAGPSIPASVWVVVYLGAAVVVVLTGLFPQQRHRSRLLVFAGAISVLGAVVVVLTFIQRPYTQIAPYAMENAVRVMKGEPVDDNVFQPCAIEPPLPPLPAATAN